MNEIKVLDKTTIDKIAAGEVVERPASVVKELLENSIDAGACAVSVEIRDGGVNLIRVTDNGSGIPKEQVKTAFLRHATSKITGAEDLSFVKSLGFRGEALSSIAAVADVELCTKTKDALTGTIYRAAAAGEGTMQDAGLPDGTTIIVRNLFANVPARRKFLATTATEAGAVLDVVQKIALSHPAISVKFTSNGSLKFNTSGNGSIKDAVYAVFGRDIAIHTRSIDANDGLIAVNGIIGDPEIARGNRAFEIYFINGRFVKSKVVASAIEAAYKGYQMKGSFPFTAFNISIEPEYVDVNVHPAKMEVRFFDDEQIYNSIYRIISDALRVKETIPEFTVNAPREAEIAPEKPFTAVAEESKEERYEAPAFKIPEPFEKERIAEAAADLVVAEECTYEQQSIFNEKFISEQARLKHRLIGEVFDTYWLIEFDEKLYIIDQHAAHEKVKYEQLLAKVKNNAVTSQYIKPGIVITLSGPSEAVLADYHAAFEHLGFQIEHFGGSEYIISAVPNDLYGLDSAELFITFLDELTEYPKTASPKVLEDRLASAACKAAVKGGNRISYAEADELITELLALENPYNCPHGRPTIITMSKQELERKFKRII